jgi:HEAT repeat protein
MNLNFMDNTTTITLKELLDTMLDENQAFLPQYLYRLSDLEREELRQFEQTWPDVPLSRRQAIMEDLRDLSEHDYVLSFEAVCQVTVEDEDPLVRLASIQILWDYESPDLIPLFLDLAESDLVMEVRSSAAAALGRYVYMGEVDEIPQSTQDMIEDRLLTLFQEDEHELVRRRALESLGYASREEVEPLIAEAYVSGDDLWIASALFAMGRSANPDWSPAVLERLEDTNPDIRFEATRAAGELEIKEAVPTLLDHLSDASDRVRLAACWSLSQTGGKGVRDALISMLDEATTDIETSFVEDALDNLTFTEGFNSFELFEFDEYDLEPYIDDLDDED